MLLQRRLFTNLFLPGGSLAWFLRMALWWTVPSPELSVLLLDWSSLFLRRNNNNGNSNTGTADETRLGVSAVAWAVLQSLALGQWQNARRLVFGQALLTGHLQQVMLDQARRQVASEEGEEASSLSSSSVLVHQRNQHALQILQHYVDDNDNVQYRGRRRRIALLYGCNHAPDLHQSLQSQYGFVPISTTWRTAWSVPIPKDQDPAQNQEASLSSLSPPILLLGLLLLGYLAVGGLDWIATWQNIVLLASSSSAAAVDATTNPGAFIDNNMNSSDEPGILVTAALYGIRHLALYIGLSRLLDWRHDVAEAG